MKYITKKGNTLEVISEPSEKYPGETIYTFLLREKKPMGENITILRKSNLSKPDYFIKQYTEEF